MRPGGVDQRRRLVCGHGERFFDQHRLAGVDGRQRRVVVAGVRRADVDSVDVSVVDQSGVRRVAVRHVETFAELVSRALAA